MTDTVAATQSPTSRAQRKGRKAVAKQVTRLERLDVVYVRVEDIRPNAYNPNRQTDRDFELLLRSIEDNGFTVPIVLRQGTNVIVDGEHRWRAAQVLGMAEIPCVHVTQSDEQAMAATLSHNRARGTEDVELTAALLRDLQALGALDHVKDSLMLDDDAVRLLIDNVPAPEMLAGDEFGDAWEPNAGGGDHHDDDNHVSQTKDGTSALHSRERALAAAKTSQDRAQAFKENQVYRVSLIFSGEEADVVRAVLGDRPAVALVALCRERAAS